MSEKITIRVMGVPEHFNLPWYQAIESGKFAAEGIDLQWQDAPGGTGAMMQALQSGETDIVVALTEGVVANIVKGTDARIVQLYVSSPLSWGVHVAGDSSYQKLEELADSRFAISRPASGSHLMAFVLGQQQAWNTKAMKFVEVGGIKGARKALAEGSADTFMWEKLMTKPIVDRGEFKRLGVVDTPWPCFVIAASRNLIRNQPEALKKLLEVVWLETSAFKKKDDAVDSIVNRFGLQAQDVEEWLARTDWANDQRISAGMLGQVMDTLLQVGAITEKISPGELCAQDFVQLH